MDSEMYGPFLHWSTYTWLCDDCREQLRVLTELFAHYIERMPESNSLRRAMLDNEEYPRDFMYDERLFCGGRCCAVHAEREREAARKAIPSP